MLLGKSQVASDLSCNANVVQTMKIQCKVLHEWSSVTSKNVLQSHEPCRNVCVISGKFNIFFVLSVPIFFTHLEISFGLVHR